MATDTKTEAPKVGNDKVADQKVEQPPGAAARTEAVNSFKPIDQNAAKPPDPVSDGAMAMKPPVSDKTMVEYFAPPGKAARDSGQKAPDGTADNTRDKRADASDKGLEKAPGSAEAAADKYKETMMRSGMSEADASKYAHDTLSRLEQTKKGADGTIEGTPEQQLNRMNKAMSDILDGSGKRPDGKLANGQDDPLSQDDRKNIVKDLAAREADPDKYVNQGNHQTCVLESNQKQRLEGGDPAKVAEQIASVVNKGSAEITEKDGKTRTVNVDSRSFAPDSESGRPFNPANSLNGERGMAGHVYDALAGQTVADLRAEREGKPTSAGGVDKASYVYLAAHADQVGVKPEQSSANEALMKRTADGSLKLLERSPGVDNVWQMAHLSKAMGGESGAVFASAGLVGDGVPPKGEGYPPDMRITAFKNAEDMHQKLETYEAKTGQSAQVLVNAPFLPGGGENGHGLHGMNVRAEANGKFDLDNNWGQKYDLGSVSGAVIDKATDPSKWDAKTAEGRSEPKPTDHTAIVPGSGRNPNESQSDYNQRLLDERKRQDEKLQEDKAKDKKPTDTTAADQRYNQDLQQWEAERQEVESNGGIFAKPLPNRSRYINE